MNKGKSKKKMNSYLKMILLMAAGGVVGGIVGFVTAFSGEDYIAVIGHGMDAFLFAVRDHALMLECICGAICLVICKCIGCHSKNRDGSGVFPGQGADFA